MGQMVANTRQSDKRRSVNTCISPGRHLNILAPCRCHRVLNSVTAAAPLNMVRFSAGVNYHVKQEVFCMARKKLFARRFYDQLKEAEAVINNATIVDDIR
ncbi:MAG: hypothetical protein IPJ94_26485 [Chloroflexi bacterium]|nr:hypothetical protein [Chloroflexota bacterium]